MHYLLEKEKEKMCQPRQVKEKEGKREKASACGREKEGIKY
jgi:hypothetical protein